MSISGVMRGVGVTAQVVVCIGGIGVSTKYLTKETLRIYRYFRGEPSREVDTVIADVVPYAAILLSFMCAAYQLVSLHRKYGHLNPDQLKILHIDEVVQASVQRLFPHLVAPKSG
jgi:hypothetical protein